MERRHNTRHAAALAAAAAASTKGHSRTSTTRGNGSKNASRENSPSSSTDSSGRQRVSSAATGRHSPSPQPGVTQSGGAGVQSESSSTVTSVEGGTGEERSADPGSPTTTRSNMYESFQTWAMKTYGDSAKTKTVTRRKYNRIAKILQGEELNSAENSKFRFWVKAKGFRVGPPGDHASSAAAAASTTPAKKKKIDDSQILYVPCGKSNGGNVKDEENAIFKKVAVVENFYDIIYDVHVEMDGRGGKHAGQKRTYKAIAETYAFLPREAVTHFLMSCSDCQKRMHLASEGGGGGAVKPRGGGSGGVGRGNGDSTSPGSSPADSVSSVVAAAQPRVSPLPQDELGPVEPPDIDYSMPITTTYLKHMRRLGYIDDENTINAAEREPDSVSNSDESEMSEAPPASQDGTLNSAECQTDEANSREELSNTFEACVGGVDEGTQAAVDVTTPPPQEEQEEEEEDETEGIQEDKEEEEGPIDMTPARHQTPKEGPKNQSPIDRLKTESWSSPPQPEAINYVSRAPIQVQDNGGNPKRAQTQYYGQTPQSNPLTSSSNNSGATTNNAQAITRTGESPYEHIMNSPVGGGGGGGETLVDNLSVSTKEEDEDDEDEDPDKIDPNQCDPERLKAFNMFVRLFVDENLDRMIPISRQPKEKIQAIIDSCSRQFPEFGDRARKRIRTYLKSCRRNKRTREQCGWDMVRPQTRPTLPHLTSALAEQILASACENESQNAKRMRLGLKPIAVQLEEVNPHLSVKASGCLGLEDTRVSQSSGVKCAKEAASLKSQAFSVPHHQPAAAASASVAAGGHHSPRSAGTAAPPTSSVTCSGGGVNLNGAIAMAAIQGQVNNNNNATCANRYQGLVYSHVPTHNPVATPTTNASVVAAAGSVVVGAPTDLSVKKERNCPSSMLKYTLNANEVTAVKQLICGYRESAAFLLRSADELEQLLLQQN